MSSTTPPGWFPDPHVPGQQRYWDGAIWTEHTAPLHQPAVPAAARAARTDAAPKNWVLRHPVLSGVGALVVLLGFAGAVAAGSGSPEPETTGASDTVVAESPAAVEEAAVEPEPEAAPVDTDGDGVVDSDDYRPDDPAVRTQDDVDTDGDGVADYQDDFPEDPAFSTDTDGDGVADRLDAFPQDERYSKDSDGDGVADSVDAFPEDPSKSEITMAMDNALSSAESYLDYTAFSRQGLIDQLSSEYGEGYDVADATWAVDQLTVDWREQAVRSGKAYLDYTSFSRQGLIDQLSSPYGEQFTVAEATYAVDKIGL